MGTDRYGRSILALQKQLFENPARDFFAAFAHLADGADAARAPRFARARGQQLRRAVQQPRSQLVKRSALSDAAGIVVIEVQIGLEGSQAAGDIFRDGYTEVARIAHDT